jgi:hypothetical protein
MELIDNTIDFVFEYLKIAFVGAHSRFKVLAISFRADEMIAEMLRQLRENTLHFIVFFGDHIG